MSVVGARPQFIKAWPLSRALRFSNTINEIFVHTGQHYDDLMSDVFFRDLDLPKPDFNLGVGSGKHGAQTGLMLEKLEELMAEIKPAIVIVFGDTNSTLAGALAAAKLQIPIAHVEAGMRCGDRFMPEEINRIATDRLTSLFFCPTENAVENLSSEGIRTNVHFTGDLMADSFHEIRENAMRNSEILKSSGLQLKNYILLTIHRAENTDSIEKLESIFAGCRVADKKIVFPAHPRTRKALTSLRLPANFDLIDPVSYSDMVALESSAYRIITDSGGVQKEAYLAGVPCLTLRDKTEWPETVESGWNLLVGSDEKQIRNGINNFSPSGERKDIFGPGGAAERISSIILDFLGVC